MILPSRDRALPVRPLAILAAMVAIAIASQVVLTLRPRPTPLSANNDNVPQLALPAVGEIDSGDGATTAGTDELVRIKADIAFWAGRYQKHPLDFVSATQWGLNEIALGRATGDVTAFLRADAAFDAALASFSGLPAATDYKASVLVSLHRFVQARDLAAAEIARIPNDPTALATLGDADLELGDLAAARDAYTRASALGRSAALLVRLGHLAFIVGDTQAALQDAKAAVAAADNEGAEGERAAFYRYQLGDTLISTGDRAGAAAAYADALQQDARSFLALSGLARVAAADGDLGKAIEDLSRAIAIVPQPEFLARRADLYTLRAEPGDAKRSADDLATVEAIAKLAGEAANVYDRTLSLYLSNHGLDPTRALRLAKDELSVRKDVYGYDAYAWALLANGQATDADAAMATALSFGTRDAKLYYHAGMIAAAVGDAGRAKDDLQKALALDPSFDPLQAQRARAALAGL
jgi:tetratricopeptide (TPR) repeat protein